MAFPYNAAPKMNRHSPTFVRILSACLVLAVAGCADDVRPPSPVAADGGAVDLTFDAGASVRDGGVSAARDGGADAGTLASGPDGGDPYCAPSRFERIEFFAETGGVVDQDVIIEGTVRTITRDVLRIEQAGEIRTLEWTLPSTASPPIAVGDFVRLLYRPYTISTYQWAAITLRAANGTLLFVGDTGLLRTRINGADLEVATISVADRGCKLFPIRCGEPRRLDLLLTDEEGKQMRVAPGDTGRFLYRGLHYEVMNVNMSELAYLSCNVIPARYRAYTIQLVP